MSTALITNTFDYRDTSNNTAMATYNVLTAGTTDNAVSINLTSAGTVMYIPLYVDALTGNWHSIEVATIVSISTHTPIYGSAAVDSNILLPVGIRDQLWWGLTDNPATFTTTAASYTEPSTKFLGITSPADNILWELGSTQPREVFMYPGSTLTGAVTSYSSGRFITPPNSKFSSMDIMELVSVVPVKGIYKTQGYITPSPNFDIRGTGGIAEFDGGILRVVDVNNQWYSKDTAVYQSDGTTLFVPNLSNDAHIYFPIRNINGTLTDGYEVRGGTAVTQSFMLSGACPYFYYGYFPESNYTVSTRALCQLPTLLKFNVLSSGDVQMAASKHWNDTTAPVVSGAVPAGIFAPVSDSAGVISIAQTNYEQTNPARDSSNIAWLKNNASQKYLVLNVPPATTFTAGAALCVHGVYMRVNATAPV